MRPERAQTPREETANALSHALGCVLAWLIWPVLEHAARQRSGTIGVFAIGVFCAAMTLQYLVSAVYHALPRGRAKQWARSFDHAAIFIFIAGSSTPFTLGVLGGGTGALSCGLIWVLALWGAWLKLMRRLTDLRLSTGLYVLLGWFALVLSLPEAQKLDVSALWWLVGGGVCYLAGSVFFVFDERLRFGHFVWHLFVLIGSACHVCAALWPVLY
jgi:hemolysin III